MNKTFENLKSEIHIIYFVMNFNNRLEEKERKFLNAHKNILNRIIFIGTYGGGLHKQFVKKFKDDLLKKKIYNDLFGFIRR